MSFGRPLQARKGERQASTSGTESNLGVTDDKSFPIVQAKKDATDSFIIEDWEAALVGTTTGEQHAVDGRRAMPEPEWV